jgi:D-glycero-D-manno-heptose 1,7-bisphosphate phosphatase
MQPEYEHVRLFIFDADGTLRRTNVEGQPCPRTADEWELLPNVRETLASLDWGPDGALVGVASNQDQVAYGYLSERTARQLLRDVLVAATGCEPPAHAVQLCPHALDAHCDCRKPSPGMLLRIVRAYGVPPERALFVGDTAVDEEAARRAGIRFTWAHDFFSRNGES